MSESKQVNRRGFLGTSVAAIAVGGAAVTAQGANTPAAAPVHGTTTMPHTGNRPRRHALRHAGKDPPQPHVSRWQPGHRLHALPRSEVRARVVPGLRDRGQDLPDVQAGRGARHQLRLRKRRGFRRIATTRSSAATCTIIPSIHPDVNQSDAEIKDEIKAKVDSGVPAMYVWGVRSDGLSCTTAVST